MASPEQQPAPIEASIEAPKNLRVEPANPEDANYQKAQKAHEKAKEWVMGLTKVQLAELKWDLLTTQEEWEASETQTTPEDSPEVKLWSDPEDSPEVKLWSEEKTPSDDEWEDTSSVDTWGR